MACDASNVGDRMAFNGNNSTPILWTFSIVFFDEGGGDLRTGNGHVGVASSNENPCGICTLASWPIICSLSGLEAFGNQEAFEYEEEKGYESQEC